nr:hypothetical protein [Tanacetum cinerariifolium]
LGQYLLPVFANGVAVGEVIIYHVPVAEQRQQAQAIVGRSGASVGLFVLKKRVADARRGAHVVVRALAAVAAQEHELLAQ